MPPRMYRAPSPSPSPPPQGPIRQHSARITNRTTAFPRQRRSALDPTARAVPPEYRPTPHPASPSFPFRRTTPVFRNPWLRRGPVTPEPRPPPPAQLSTPRNAVLRNQPNRSPSPVSPLAVTLTSLDTRRDGTATEIGGRLDMNRGGELHGFIDADFDGLFEGTITNPVLCGGNLSRSRRDTLQDLRDAGNEPWLVQIELLGRFEGIFHGIFIGDIDNLIIYSGRIWSYADNIHYDADDEDPVGVIRLPFRPIPGYLSTPPSRRQDVTPATDANATPVRTSASLWRPRTSPLADGQANGTTSGRANAVVPDHRLAPSIEHDPFIRPRRPQVVDYSSSSSDSPNPIQLLSPFTSSRDPIRPAQPQEHNLEGWLSRQAWIERLRQMSREGSPPLRHGLDLLS